MSDLSDAERIDALEMKIAYQEEAIEQLNEVITAQWKKLDEFARELIRLNDRIEAAGANAPASPGDEPPPPHY
ncbi:MAG: SlyX family protein [Xanthobacteraceae bacterium]|nr:SlyX family protein [Xanthobacteraceae bacterium]